VFASEREMYPVISRYLLKREERRCEETLCDTVTFPYLSRKWRADVLGIFRVDDVVNFVGVEAKTDLEYSHQALRQVLALQSFCSEVYLAVPLDVFRSNKSRGQELLRVLAGLNIGLLLVGKRVVRVQHSPKPIQFQPHIYSYVLDEVGLAQTLEQELGPEWRDLMLRMMNDKRAWLSSRFAFYNPQGNYAVFRGGYLPKLKIELRPEVIEVSWTRGCNKVLRRACRRSTEISEAVLDLSTRITEYRSKIGHGRLVNGKKWFEAEEEPAAEEELRFTPEPNLVAYVTRDNNPWAYDAPSEIRVGLGLLDTPIQVERVFEGILGDKGTHVSSIGISWDLMWAVVDLDHLTKDTAHASCDSVLLHRILRDLSDVMRTIVQE